MFIFSSTWYAASPRCGEREGRGARLSKEVFRLQRTHRPITDRPIDVEVIIRWAIDKWLTYYSITAPTQQTTVGLIRIIDELPPYW